MPDKTALRKRFLQARRSLSPEKRAEKSLRAAENLLRLPEYAKAVTVMVYAAMPGELDLSPLIRHPASAGKRFLWPVCTADGGMKAMIPGAWRRGAFDIPEPDPDLSQEIPPEEIDLVICPGVAFDDAKTRLGMGGGYYDRFLPKCRHAAIVLAAYEAQHAPHLPREETDIPMHRIVTEKQIY